tara:strand:- start:2381 stop:2521 length:141 start_codon:yes stop_codon:yes gene_type:complete
MNAIDRTQVEWRELFAKLMVEHGQAITRIGKLEARLTECTCGVDSQ